MTIKIAITILIAILMGIQISSILNQQSIDQIITQKPKVAIIDQLNLTFPNQNFVQESTYILQQAGYTVDYYSDNDVTIGLYRNLPRQRYKLIILRVHSVLDNKGVYVNLFTSEHYDKDKYIYEQLSNSISKLGMINRDRNVTFYFGITPNFVRNLDEKFDNTTIIVMGCNGLTTPEMAQSFVDKGAKIFIGWNANVTPYHTDLMTIYLLRYLFIEKLTYKESIMRTFKDKYGGILTYYPSKVENDTIIDIDKN